MSVARKLEELARLVPGVGGHHDRESWREVDRLVRLRLTAGLEQIRLEIEELQRRLAERREFTLLPVLGRVAAKVEKVANLAKFGARGYRGLFDRHPLDQGALARLCAFDERLLDHLRGVEAVSATLLAGPSGAAVGDEIQAFEEAVDALERRFLSRTDLLGPASG